MRERNSPFSASGPTQLHVWFVWSSRGRGGWKHVLALPIHAQLLPAVVLQPQANLLCEKWVGLSRPETMSPTVCPTMLSDKLACICTCCQLCECCSHRSKGLLTFPGHATRTVPKYVFHSFCSIKSPSKSNLFSVQIGFAQLGKYWTSKFFLGNKFPLKSMRQASHLFPWHFVRY